MQSVNPKIQVLSSSQKETIHDASLQILSKTGVRVDSIKARDLFVRAGCIQSSDNCISISKDLIDWAIKASPDSVQIYNRTGSKAFKVGKQSEDQPVFGIGVTNLWYQEPENDQIEKFSRRHTTIASHLCENLNNYQVLSTPGVPQDVQQNIADLYSTLDMVANTTKSQILLISDGSKFKPTLEMLTHLFGDLNKNPFIIPYFNPITPLVIDEKISDQMFIAIEYGLPFIYSSYGMAGATSPITPASSLVMLNAELLAGLVLSQLIREGTPVILGILPAAFDMQKMTSVYTPQTMLLNLACSEMMDYYNIPHAGTSGSGPGWETDLSAAGALWMNHLTSFLGKVGMAPFVGGNFDSLVFSPELVVYADQVINQSKQFSSGFSLDVDTLGLDELNSIGPGGNFLTANQTLSNLQEQQSSLIGLWPVFSPEEWQKNKRPKAGEVLKNRTMDIIKNANKPSDQKDLISRGEAFIKTLNC